MGCAFPITMAILSCLWNRQSADAQDDPVAKARNERELDVYGTALVTQFKNSPSLSGAAILSSKPDTRAHHRRSAYPADEGQKEVLSMDKPPALPKFQPEYLRGVNLFPADWTLSDSYEEYNKSYREIFWQGK